MKSALDLTHEELNDGLRLWAATNDANVRGAVELLIDHGTWTRRRDLIERAVYIPEDDPNLVVIQWSAARVALEDGLRGSTSELTILRTAIALATDGFGWAGLGRVHRADVLRAVQTTLGGE